MRGGNQLVAVILEELAAMVAPGVTTAELDGLAEARVARGRRQTGVQGVPRLSGDDVRLDERARSSTGFRRAPALADGDVVSLDMGVKLDGYFGDSRGHGAGRQGRRGRAARCCRSREEALDKRRSMQVQGGRPDLRHRPRDSGACRGVRVLGGPGVRRARDRRGRCTRSRDRELRRTGTRPPAGRGDGPGNRADGERPASRR